MGKDLINWKDSGMEGFRNKETNINVYTACWSPVSAIISNGQFILNLQEDIKLLRTYVQK